MWRRISPVSAGVVVLTLAACMSDSPLAPSLPHVPPEGASLGQTPSGLPVELCKHWMGAGPAPLQHWDFGYRVSQEGSTVEEGTVQVSLAEPILWEGCITLGSWPEGSRLHVEELVPPGFQVDLILGLSRTLTTPWGDPAPVIALENPGPPAVSFLVEDVKRVYFKNSGAPPEPGGGEGCTPGFWRQPQHHVYWPAPYTPQSTAWGDVFSEVNGAGSPGRARGRAVSAPLTGSTLLSEAVMLTGGGLNALARQAVAALLNAASPNVSYDLSVVQVVDLVNSAIATGDFEGAKDRLEGFNEQVCTAKQ